jgi:hypothetical protein
MIARFYGMNILDLTLSDKHPAFETIFRDPGDDPGGDGPYNGDEENIFKKSGRFFLLRPL